MFKSRRTVKVTPLTVGGFVVYLMVLYVGLQVALHVAAGVMSS